MDKATSWQAYFHVSNALDAYHFMTLQQVDYRANVNAQSQDNVYLTLAQVRYQLLKMERMGLIIVKRWKRGWFARYQYRMESYEEVVGEELEQEPDELDDELDEWEQMISDCFMTQAGYCTVAGSEYCDWDCPFGGWDDPFWDEGKLGADEDPVQ